MVLKSFFSRFLKDGITHFSEQVELFQPPYQEEQPDENGDLRKVWIFPLRLADGGHVLALPEDLIAKKQQQKDKEAKRLSEEELQRRAKYSTKGVGVREVTSKVYERNAYVSELAKRRANGICQLCENPAPFHDPSGTPFLETHHIEWLSEAGEDTIENTVALCPNCHRMMHVLKSNSNLKKLKFKALRLSE